MFQDHYTRVNMKLNGLVKKNIKVLFFLLSLILFNIIFFQSCKFNKNSKSFNEHDNKNETIFDLIKKEDYEVIFVVNNLKDLYSNESDESLFYKGIIKSSVNYKFPINIIEKKKEVRIISSIDKILSNSQGKNGKIIVGYNIELDFEFLDFLQKNNYIFFIDIITNYSYIRVDLNDYQNIKKTKLDNLVIVYPDYKKLNNILENFISFIIEKNLFFIKDLEGYFSFQLNYLYDENIYFFKELFEDYEKASISSKRNYLIKFYNIGFNELNSMSNKQIFENFNFNNLKKITINISSIRNLLEIYNNFEINLVKNVLFVPLFSKNFNENIANYTLFLFYINWIEIIYDLLEKIVSGSNIEKEINIISNNYYFLDFNQRYLNIVPNYNSSIFNFIESNIENKFFKEFF